MKKAIIMMAILIGFSASANAMTKTQACKAVEYMGEQVVEFKNLGGTYSQAIAISEPSFAGLSQKDKNYFVGVVAIAFETNLSPKAYGDAVYLNCLTHY